MREKQDRALRLLALLFAALLLITAFVNFKNVIRRNFFVSLLSLLTIPLPFVLEFAAKRKNILLPEHFRISILSFLFCTQFLGELVGFYYTLWWWDLMLHGYAGIYASVIGVWLSRNTIKRHEGTTTKRFVYFVALFSLCFSISLSTLWEVFEFISDILLKTNMMQEGLKDSFTDLILGIILAALTSSIYYVNNRKSD